MHVLFVFLFVRPVCMGGGTEQAQAGEMFLIPGLYEKVPRQETIDLSQDTVI